MNLDRLKTPVLVTGASGFLGEHLARHLAASRVAVVGTYFVHDQSIPRADLIPVDLRDGGSVERLVRDLRPAAVFHCAALTDVAACEKDPASARAAILDATTHLAGAIARIAPQTPLVALSTDLVFDGEAAPYGVDSRPKPLSVYGSLKWQAESPVGALARGCVVRAALLYGPPARHRGSFLAWMTGALARGERLPLFEDEVRTPIHVEDLCRVLAALTEREATGVWHAGGSERLSRLAMGRLVCREHGFDESLLEPRRLAESTYAAPRPRDVSLDSARTWQTLGLVPRTFAQGLRDSRAAGPSETRGTRRQESRPG